MVVGLNPVVFDFSRHWNFKIWTLLKTPQLETELDRIYLEYQDLAEFKYEETLGFDAEYAKAVYHLDLHTAQVMCRDLDWLQQSCSPFSLAQLSLAIAKELYPEKEWNLLESRDAETCVVTDPERSLVFDMHNFKTLSAGALLAIVEDKSYQPTRSDLEEMNRFLGARFQRQEDVLADLGELIKRDDHPATVTPLKKE